MFNYAQPELVSLVFSLFVIGSNLLSNLILARSTYSLFFLQIAYQLSHTYRDANNFTNKHRWSFFDFESAFQCFNYLKCSFAIWSGISLSLILIIASVFTLRNAWTINTLVAKRSCSIVFLLFLSGFEWVQIPSIISSLYLYSAFLQKTPIILGTIATILSLVAMVISVVTLTKKFRNQGDNKDDTYFEKVMISLLFITLSVTSFGISKGANFTQGIVLLATHLLIVICVLIYKRSNKRGIISQIRNANLGFQAICFLWLASRLENNLFADNLTDSFVTLIIIGLDILFIIAEIALGLKHSLQPEDGLQQKDPYTQREKVMAPGNRRLSKNNSIGSFNYLETSKYRLPVKDKDSSRQKHPDVNLERADSIHTSYE